MVNRMKVSMKILASLVFTFLVMVAVTSCGEADGSEAADKLKNAIGKLDWFFTWKDGGTFVKIASNQLQIALGIKGITRARTKETFYKCW